MLLFVVFLVSEINLFTSVILGPRAGELIKLNLLTAHRLDFLDLLGGLRYFRRQIGLCPCLGRLRQEGTRPGQLGVALLELHHLRLRLLTTHGAPRSLCLLLLLLGHDLLLLLCLRLPFSSRQHLSS